MSYNGILLILNRFAAKEQKLRMVSALTPFEGGARATELESSGALVEQPLEWVLPLPGPGMMEEANWDVSII